MQPSLSLQGVFPILATPFDAQENLDLDSLARIVAFMAEIGVDGITILGVLGEANRLSDEERTRVITTSLAAANGQLPVVVGVSHGGTRAAMELARQAERLGAAALMLTPLADPALDEERIFELFARVAAACPLPMVVQDHPASTGVQMSTSLLLRLARDIATVACFKEEALPTAPKIRALRAGLERPVAIMTGLGALYGLFDLEAGSDGFMTGFAFPEILIAMRQAWSASRQEEAAALYRRFLPLLVFEQQPGVAVRKEILRRRGLLACNRVRHPGSQLNPTAAAQLDRILDQTLPGIDLTRPLKARSYCATVV